MATPSDARAVKSLNNSEGRQRFVFKNFSQRINDIEINVFRSLDKVKAEPSAGSSFFRDCLVEWRELNTAEDFILFYEEMLPFVQTLPLVILQKELIFSKLVSRLQMKARLSLEPLLRLIAELSRDLLEDFLPFLPRIVNSFVTLLKNGAQKEPEIIEQIFSSWCYIIMYLQKYLICDIEGILRDTLELRYYPKEHISEFMSESMSFLLRNAPDEQLERGIKTILSEAERPDNKGGGVSLLYHVMKRGIHRSIHSKAGRVLRFLLKDSTLSFFDNFPQGSDTVVEVVRLTLERLCEDLEAEKLDDMWNCLYREIEESILNRNSVHLGRLLNVLTAVVKIQKGLKVHDYPFLIGLVSLIVSTFAASSEPVVEGDNLSAVLDEVLQLMLHTINSVNDIEAVASQWAPIFVLKSSRFLDFLRDLLQKDQPIVKAFTNNILSAINNLIWESSEEIIPLLLTLCERQQTSQNRANIVDQTFDSRYEKIHEFLEEKIKKVQQNIENTGLSQIDEVELAAVWGVVNCYPYFKVDSSLLISFKKTLRQHLAVSDDAFSAPELMQQSLLGTALRSCHKLAGRINHSDVEEALSYAKDYRSCAQVLSAVADFLDSMQRPSLVDGDRSKAYPEFQVKKTEDAFGIFSENLRHPNKDIRLMTLRILCHFESLSPDPSFEEHPPKKTTKTEESKKSLPRGNVLQLLRSIEETDATVDTGRMLVSLISRMQMDVSAGRIHAAYVQLVLNGMMGLLHIRYFDLWGPASECLAVLLRNHTGAIWSDFVSYLSHCQLKFLTLHHHSENENHSMSKRDNDLIGCFNSFLFPPSDSTPIAMVVSQLLQTLQKVSTVAQPRASEILPLFLEFLGYNRENPVSVGLYDGRTCKGDDWKRVLIQWLTLLKLMKNPRSFRFSQFINDVLQIRFLDDNDSEIQTNVLECLLLSNNFLLPHRQHLLNLIKPKELREELTTWNLPENIEEAHRSHFVSLVIRILMPKVRTLKNSASRKHTSIRHRKAVLCFISQLDVNELALFFALLIKPLNIIPEETMDLFWNSGKSSLDYFQKSIFLKHFTVDALSTLSRNQKSGFLHVIQHILEVFDELRVRPFLDFLMGCVVRLLMNCAPNIDEVKNIESSAVANDIAAPSTSDIKENVLINHDQAGTALKQFKELRSLCLKIIAHVLDKYENCDLGSEFWDLFFLAVNPLIKSFKQEGSSSEKPSSLFSSFLSMSKSSNLVTLLCREESLIPDIFSILTVSTASEAVKSSALKFIENLLCLENELDEDDSMIKGFLDPYIDALVNSLHSLFIGDIMKRKSVKYHGEREVKILKLLSKHIRDRSRVMKYLDVLLSFLDNNVKDSDIRREALLAIQDITALLGTESTSKIVNIISPLLVDAELDVRLCICDLLESLAKIDFSLDDVAKRVRDMNAISPMEVDDLDYEKIVDAYVEINVDFFNKSSEQHTMIILSQSIYNLSSESIMLRGSAQKLLSSFIDFSASILCQEASAHSDSSKEVKIADASWTGSRVLCILRNFILKHIGDAINRGILIKEWILLIREMVTKLPAAGNLTEFRPLCSEDDNLDFFKSIIHIQAHRRAKAISRFANELKDSSLPEGVVRKLLVSVFFNMLLDEQDGKDNNVRDACIEALASVSAHMSWKSYYALLNRCFREMNKHTKKGKLLLRLICLILDKFHFAKDDYPQEVEEIRTCLQKTVFPKIQKLMNSDSDSVNVHSRVAALKVLKLLPQDVMDSNLSSIIHKIASFLKNRLESTRNEARLALAASLKELGLEYLQVVVNILRAILKRGSEVHVLGYTVNFILSACLSNPTHGKLDHCLVDLLAVVETDIFGEVAEQKDVEKFASKMKETRQRKSFETLKLIAENVTFRTQAMKLLSPVTAQLQRHLTPKIKLNLEKMLKQIAAGIEGNPSVDQGDLFVFIYGHVDDGINNRSGLLVDQISSQPSKKKRKSGSVKETAGLISGANTCPHLITVFALELLHNRLKKKNIGNTDEELLSKLDPFVKLLASCLSSKYEDIVSSSLRCFTSLVGLPLPSLVSEADEVKTALLTIAQSAVSSSSPLVQSCLKLLTTLLGNKNITLTSEQLKILIQFPIFVDLESDQSFVALSLLKAIMKRKLVVPEIYDIAVQVSELMVRNHLESTRKKCKQILLQFLVHYQLSEKRLEQHVNSLLENLRYEHQTGREAVLDMLHALILKFSEPRLGKQSVLNKQSGLLFIRLALCLAIDDNKEVRSRIGAVIELLIGRIGKDQVDFILSYCMSWYKQQNLRAAAAQVLGFVVDVMKKTFRKHIDNILQDAKSILESAVNASSLQLQDIAEEASIPFWKEAYYSLVMMEKMLRQFRDLIFRKDLEDIWRMVFEFLLHPHPWLRSKSCLLLNLYFEALAGRKRAETLVANSLLEKPSSLFMVAVCLCVQLKEQPTIDNIDADLLTANIVFAVSSLHSLIGLSDQAAYSGFWSSLGKDEQVVFLRAFEALDSGKGRSTFLALTSGKHTPENSENDANDVRNVLIGSLLKRMGKIALDFESFQMRIVFNTYKAITSQMNQEECRLYAYKILLPLYKVCEGFTGKTISDELKHLAEEVRDSIRDNTLGNQTFVEVYSEIRKSLRAKREKRKREEKLMAVVNPERNAKRKLRLASKNKANKKRRITSMKLSRWSRS